MNTVRQYCLVRGRSGLIFYVDSHELMQFRHEPLTILNHNLTLEEAQALFKISKHNQGELK